MYAEKKGTLRLREEFEQYLNDKYGDVDVCGNKYPAGSVLLRYDSAAFDNLFDAELDNMPQWLCGACGNEFETPEEANNCCLKG